MSATELPQTQTNSPAKPPEDQANLEPELGNYLEDRFQNDRIYLIGTDSQILAQNLRQRGLQTWCEADSKPEGKFDLLVCLNPKSEQTAIMAEVTQNSEAVLLAWDSSLWHIQTQPTDELERWLIWFTQSGFYPDPAQRIQISKFNTIFLHKTNFQNPASLAAAYERLLWQRNAEIQARRDLLVDMRDELSVNGFDTAQIQVRLNEMERLRQQNEDLRRAYQEIYNSRSWRLMRRLHPIRQRIFPTGSGRERLAKSLFRGLILLFKEGPLPSLARAYRQFSWKLHSRSRQTRFRSPEFIQSQSFQVPAIEEKPLPGAHSAQIDVIVCVHNALEDVRRCLESVLSHSNQPYRLILVDDGSQPETREYLDEFASQHECTLLHNENARGYTFAANQGMRAAQGDFTVLLNSDTIVTRGWLDKLTACAQSDDWIGVVGPLSNTASWQSIPLITEYGDWAMNPLPANLTVDEMGALVEAGSARLYPEMKLLNGFCLFIRRAVREQIGLFDEDHFGAGYGEEDDYCLRARAAGWKLALADDTYIYHAQSKSYSTERRKQLYERAGKNLLEKHGEAVIQAGVEYNQHNPILQGIRARSQLWLARQDLIAAGKRSFASKRVLFVLPIMFAGGGGNVIISEALAMRRMGVDVRFYNLPEFRRSFEQSYPDLSFPVIYASEQELPQIGSRFDAVIATINTSVAWLQDIAKSQPQVKLGYYVQGFEPLMYPEGTPEHHNALHSYTLFPELVPFTKTAWTRQQVQDHTGAVCQIVGPSVEIDLFRPRPAIWRAEGKQPIKIAAMVRADSAYRSPHLTMDVLQKASWRYGSDIEILLFGIDPNHPEFTKLPVEFAWRATGLLSSWQVARLMNEIDIFVDFSQHQAMGLSALEAMACGAAVIVPQNGGAVEFVKDGQNGLVVDTSSLNVCWKGLQRLIEDSGLRRRIQEQALADVCQYFPERAAHNILKVLFNG